MNSIIFGSKVNCEISQLALLTCRCTKVPTCVRAGRQVNFMLHTTLCFTPSSPSLRFSPNSPYVNVMGLSLLDCIQQHAAMTITKSALSIGCDKSCGVCKADVIGSCLLLCYSSGCLNMSRLICWQVCLHCDQSSRITFLQVSGPLSGGTWRAFHII